VNKKHIDIYIICIANLYILGAGPSKVAGPPVIIDVDADSLPASPNALPASPHISFDSLPPSPILSERQGSLPASVPEVIEEGNRPDKIVPEDVQEVELEDVPEIVPEDALDVLEDVPEDVPDVEQEDVPENMEENMPEDVLVGVPTPDDEHSLGASKGEYRHFLISTYLITDN